MERKTNSLQSLLLALSVGNTITEVIIFTLLFTSLPFIPLFLDLELNNLIENEARKTREPEEVETEKFRVQKKKIKV